MDANRYKKNIYKILYRYRILKIYFIPSQGKGYCEEKYLKNKLSFVSKILGLLPFQRYDRATINVDNI